MEIEEKDRIYNCVIIPNGFWKGFKKVASILEQNIGIKFSQKLDGFDSYYWIIDFEGVEFNLHYHEMIGDVELFTEKERIENKQVLMSLTDQIEKYLL